MVTLVQWHPALADSLPMMGTGEQVHWLPPFPSLVGTVPTLQRRKPEAKRELITCPKARKW